VPAGVEDTTMMLLGRAMIFSHRLSIQTTVVSLITVTHPASFEEVDHTVTIVEHSGVQVVRNAVSAAGFGAEVGGDAARKSIDHLVSIVVILVIRITFEAINQ